MRIPRMLLPLCAVVLLRLALALFSSPTDRIPASAPAASSADAPAVFYEIPPMKTAEFHKDTAETDGSVSADLSCLSEGYIAVSASAEMRLKFQVRSGDSTYNYDLPSDGTPSVYPLNLGDGDYTFRVLQNITEDKYSEIWSKTAAVTLENEFAPFLRPSQMVSYDGQSACVQTARDLAAECADDTEVTAAIYDYLVASIRYDHEKADTVQSGYLPDPDETLSSGTGICFDYAALAAAMLRSVGIPCKLVTGYVDPDEIYHAWDVIYLEHQGWITVEIQADANGWKRIDTTFAASGVPASQTDDDALYTTRFTY